MHTFKVWAPDARTVEVKIGEKSFSMEQRDGGWWMAEIAEAGPGTDYAFVVNGEEPALPDPRSRWQPQGVHGPSRVFNLGEWDLGAPDAAAGNGEKGSGGKWTDDAWRPPPLNKAILYELHLGTFTPEGTLAAAESRLGYLADLGITHIELMPVATFAGERGWGYDGVDLYAPHRAYGGPAALQHFVNACHEAGLGVLLDVVYNHFGPTGNYLPKFAPYLTSSHVTPWGDAVNLEEAESDGVRRFFIDNALMWLRDYHFDGLRLDAVHALVDRSAIHFVEQLAAEIHQLGSSSGKDFIVIAESDLNNPRLVWAEEAGGYGLDAQWSDDFHHALFTVLTGEKEGYYEDFGSLADLAKALEKMFVYDGVYSRYRKRHHGRPARGLPGHRFLGYIQNHDQIGNRAKGERIGHLVSLGRAKIAAAIVLTSPFVPLLFQGEEFGASTPFQYFTGYEDAEMGRLVSEGRKREFAAFGWKPEEIPDPQDRNTFESSKLRWEEVAESPHREMLAWYKKLIKLRQSLADLSSGPPVSTRVRYDEQARWLIVERSRARILCNLGSDTIRLELGGRAELLLASDESAVLDEQGIALCPDAAAIVLLAG